MSVGAKPRAFRSPVRGPEEAGPLWRFADRRAGATWSPEAAVRAFPKLLWGDLLPQLFFASLVSLVSESFPSS